MSAAHGLARRAPLRDILNEQHQPHHVQRARGGELASAGRDPAALVDYDRLAKKPAPQLQPSSRIEQSQKTLQLEQQQHQQQPPHPQQTANPDDHHANLDNALLRPQKHRQPEHQANDRPAAATHGAATAHSAPPDPHAQRRPPPTAQPHHRHRDDPNHYHYHHHHRHHLHYQRKSPLALSRRPPRRRLRSPAHHIAPNRVAGNGRAGVGGGGATTAAAAAAEPAAGSSGSSAGLTSKGVGSSTTTTNPASSAAPNLPHSKTKTPPTDDNNIPSHQQPIDPTTVAPTSHRAPSAHHHLSNNSNNLHRARTPADANAHGSSNATSLQQTSSTPATSVPRQPRVESLVPCPRWTLRDFAVGPILGRSRNPVFLARHVDSGTRVALKRIPRDSLRVPSDARLMCRELTIHAALSAHPDAIARLFGFFWDHAHIYLVLEHADSGDLQAALSAAPNGRLNERRAARIIASVAKALQYCHSAGVAHRDVKPGNILLYSTALDAKLTDFGLSDFVCPATPASLPMEGTSASATEAVAAAHKRPLVRAVHLAPPSGPPQPSPAIANDPGGLPPGFGDDLAHVVSLQQRHNRPLKRSAAKSQLVEWVGTHDYMSPQILALRSTATASRHAPKPEAYDERCDLWALGCLIYECVVGCPPFFHDDLEATYRRIETCDLRFPPVPRLSPECRLLIRKLLHRDPAKRPTPSAVLRSTWIQRNTNNASHKVHSG